MTTRSPLTPEEIAAVRKPYRAASLLPGRAYHDPAIHEFERSEWFRRDWIVVGREEDAAAPGTYFLAEVDDEPLIVVRAATACCARSTTSAAIAARPWSRSSAARPSASSARTTPGSTTSTGRSSGPSTPTTSTTSAWPSTASSPSALATWQGFVFVSLDPDGRAARGLARRPRPASRPLRLRGAARRAHGDLRGRRELEVRRPRTTASATTARASIRSSTS